MEEDQDDDDVSQEDDTENKTQDEEEDTQDARLYTMKLFCRLLLEYHVRIYSILVNYVFCHKFTLSWMIVIKIHIVQELLTLF